jgi:hypothetical protein
LQILHGKLNFVGNIYRGYDDQYAQSGAKIGDNLTVRLPNQYEVTDGPDLVAQDTSESSVVITINKQKHVGMNFTSKELTLDMDDFAERIIEPAMAVLAARMESDAYTMFRDVYNVVDNDASALTFKNILQGRQQLNDNLAPIDNNRCVTLSTKHNVDTVDALKGLFHDDKAITQQYKEGMMGRTGGFKFFENTHVADHLTGTAAKTTGYVVNGTAEAGAAITVDGGTTTFLVGDVITFAGVNRVHHETKIDSGGLQRFVITAISGASATSLAISPSLVASGAKQNVTGVPADNAAVVKVGAGASELLTSSMAFHKNAFCLATADLVLPGGAAFAARQVYDGISMRIWKDSDIKSDKHPCRVDILYGYKTLRPELAVRLHADG